MLHLIQPSQPTSVQLRRSEHGKVLGHTLPSHVQVLTELAQRLAVVGVQTVHELPPPRVGERLEQQVCVAHGADNMQVTTCMSRTGSSGCAVSASCAPRPIDI